MFAVAMGLTEIHLLSILILRFELPLQIEDGVVHGWSDHFAIVQVALQSVSLSLIFAINL
jgi:hypothetical protein